MLFNWAAEGDFSVATVGFLRAPKEQTLSSGAMMQEQQELILIPVI